MGDIHYQRKLCEDFRKRRLHPSTEIRIWEYTLGRPKEQIEMSANVTMNEWLAAEREALQQLDLHELEKLAAESQALVDRALAAAQERLGARDIIDVPAALPVSRCETASTSDDENAGDDVVPAPSNLPVDAGRETRHDKDGVE